MSKNKKVTEQNEQKVVTKYDLKMQRRKEQKEKARKEQRITTAVSIAVLVAIVCLIASFPINTYKVTNGSYITVGGESVSQLEYDYRYNVVMNNYLSQFGEFVSYLGIDFTKDLSEQMFDETMTWKDYFDQMTVDAIKQSKAVLKQADAEGFTFDATEGIEEFKENINTAATTAGLTTRVYIKQAYGSYATMNRIDDFVKEDLRLEAYFEKLEGDMAPEDSEVQEYYENNKDDYDSVDYRIEIVKAELASEEPTEAEIEKAMADAKKKAEESLTTIATDGELTENVTKATVASDIADWLFDSSRKAGDTTMIEDVDDNQYYVLAFEQRYLDETIEEGATNPQWKQDIIDIFTNDSMSVYLEEIVADVNVEDPKGNLNYLTLPTEEDAEALDAEASDAETESTEESSETAESSQAQ